MAEKSNGRFTFWEGWYDYIRDLDSPEEKLEAYETICQMAFLGPSRYVNPERPIDGDISPLFRVRRQVFHLIHGILWKTKGSCQNSDVDYGSYSVCRGRPRTGETREEYLKRTEERRRQMESAMASNEGGIGNEEDTDDDFPYYADDDTSSTGQLQEHDAAEKGEALIQAEKEREERSEELSEAAKRRIEQATVSQWKERIKNWQDLQAVIVNGYFGADMKLAQSEEFCRYALWILCDQQDWKNVVTGRAIQNDLMNIIHSLVRKFAYMKQKDSVMDKKREAWMKESADKLDEAIASQMSDEEMAELNRKRRIAANRKAKKMGLK